MRSTYFGIFILRFDIKQILEILNVYFTKPPLIGKSKFVALANALYKQASQPIGMDR